MPDKTQPAEEVDSGELCAGIPSQERRPQPVGDSCHRLVQRAAALDHGGERASDPDRLSDASSSRDIVFLGSAARRGSGEWQG